MTAHALTRQVRTGGQTDGSRTYIANRGSSHIECITAIHPNSDAARETPYRNSGAGVDESPRARFRTKDISIFKMYRNKLNFYDLADIEELAGDILMYGLKQNLEVVFEPNEQGEYRIVAGERRWLALKYLVKQGYKDFEIATCKLTTPQDEDEEQVEIIIATVFPAVKLLSTRFREEQPSSLTEKQDSQRWTERTSSRMCH